MNEAVYRKLRLNESYVKLKDSEESEVREYIIQKQAQAGWLKTCIEQRSHTLQRIADILIDFQRTFLETGKDMKPLRQKDVAQIMENIYSVAEVYTHCRILCRKEWKKSAVIL